VTTQNTPSRPQSLVQSQEYSPPDAGRAHGSGGVGSRRVRLFYFGAASIWGFVIGVAGLLVGMGFSGTPATPEPTAILGLLPAAGIAIAGGGVIAGAYQEAKRRRR
jgi:hypothetical protein